MVEVLVDNKRMICKANRLPLPIRIYTLGSELHGSFSTYLIRKS